MTPVAERTIEEFAKSQIRAPREVAKRKVRAKANHDTNARKATKTVKKTARTTAHRSKR